MAIEPIHARCRRCDTQLLLAQVVRDTSGRCPGCDEVLAPGYTFLLLEETRRAETLQRSLILSLRRLQGLPGNLALDVASVLRNALSEVDWNEQLADDRDIIRQHAAQVVPRARAWRSLPGRDRQPGRTRLAASIRSLAQRVRRHADHIEQAGPDTSGPHADPATLRSAADTADAAADAVMEDRRLSDDIVRDAMTVVDDSLDRVTRAGPSTDGARDQT